MAPCHSHIALRTPSTGTSPYPGDRESLIHPPHGGGCRCERPLSRLPSKAARGGVGGSKHCCLCVLRFTSLVLSFQPKKGLGPGFNQRSGCPFKAQRCGIRLCRKVFVIVLLTIDSRKEWSKGRPFLTIFSALNPSRG